MTTLSGVMCTTSQCRLRYPFQNLRGTNVIFIVTYYYSHLILSLITRWLAILAFSSYRGIVGHITTMMDYAQIHIFDACGHYKGRLLLILILHNVMHDITSTLPVDVAPSARFTQNGRPMSIAGGRQEWFGYYWLWYYTLPRIESSPSFWMTRLQRSRRRDKGLNPGAQ